MSNDETVATVEVPKTVEGVEKADQSTPTGQPTALDAVPNGLKESDVGITEYVSPNLPGFKGLLKSRYTDFLVNEIDTNGNVIHLTDMGIVEEDAGAPAEEDANSSSQAPIVPDDVKNELVEMIGQEDYDQIVSIFETREKFEMSKVFEDKSERGKLHGLFKKAFRGRLETTTNPANNTLTVEMCTKKPRRRAADLVGTGKYQKFLHFTIYKENKETMEVANLITKILRCAPKSVTFAGTKDRRGVTVQRACIAKVKSERLNGLNKGFRGIRLGGYEYQSGPLKLGDLDGNEFFITVRNVDGAHEEQIGESLKSLKEKGFINYFGMQRFGTFSVATHSIGACLLRGDYQKAVDLLLSEQEVVNPESAEARKVWAETKDASKAIALMPKKFVAEYAVLSVLSRIPTEIINSIMKIPRNLRLMYVHAYQSYVWNLAVSFRIKKYGWTVIPGDLVMADKVEELPAADSDDFYEDVKVDDFERARPVTEEEIQSNTKTIFDVVLPTPGYDIIYPDNSVGELYKEVMAKDGLNPHQMRRSIKEFSLAGSYRNILDKPKSCEWWFSKYDELEDQLVSTDYDLLCDSNLPRLRIKESGKNTALILKMQLGTSQYATMALREVMKNQGE